MNNILYRRILHSFLVISLMSITSCTNSILDDINEDVNHSTVMAPNFIITEIETCTAFDIVGSDYNTYAAVAIEHETGVFGQMYTYDDRSTGPEDPSTYDNMWSEQYNLLLDCKDVIEQCTTGDYEGYYFTRGIAEVMLAYNLALLTDLFGDTPWSQSGNYEEYMQPELDKQEDIYEDVFSYLDMALEDIALGDLTDLSSSDLIYNGDADLWIKAIYGLKARYTMRLLNRSSDQTSDLNKVLEYISQSFTSADEEMKFDHYDASTFYNPYYVFCRSRDYYGLSESLSDKMIERNDPRAQQVFVNSSLEQITPDSEDFLPAPNGESLEVQTYYNQSACDWAETAPTQLLSYHELLFLKAEAEVRLGQDASSTLQSAMEAAFENLAISIQAAIKSSFSKYVTGTCTLSAADVADHFESDILPLYNANPLKEVMVQKYLAFFGASGESIEAYNDIRRLKGEGEDLVELINPNNEVTQAHPDGQFIYRYVYGSSDTTTNPNVYDAYGDGSYVYSEPVWWAGGTR